MRTPSPSRRQRLALRWLTRRSARRLVLDAAPGSLRLSAAVATLISVVVGLFAISRGAPMGSTVSAMLLAPLLVEHLPGRLDARARAHVHIVEGDRSCRYLQRLATLHTFLVQAAAGSDRYELRRSAEIGHQLLFDAAGLLHGEDTLAVSEYLVARERLMAQLVHQVTQTLERTRAASTSGRADQSPGGEGPLGPLPPGFEPAARPTPASAPGTSLLKGNLPMPQTETQTGGAARTADVYLLFAHEAYYPGPGPGTGTLEINTTVVAAGSLLHPQVRQPDGARIHDRLTRGRQPGEIIPLSTLTHELDGGTGWPRVGDWETVTTDLVQLVRTGECDALSLGLPEIGRALVCAGPTSQVQAFNATGQVITYGPQERAAVLAEIDMFLTALVAEREFWPGDGLLTPLFRP
ncbi:MULTISPECIES: hypothetical protein [unclassified Streptomyces]|uniref:hypothetical protein n=1 Tax=unclassified Streptomyces TaxID=2593676 RepID=UPI0036EF27F8